MASDRRAVGVIAVLLSVLFGHTIASAEDAGLGKKIYAERCAPCHGDQGAGDGPAAAALVPKPRNFRDPEFWHGRTAVQLRLVVRDGKPGTLMSPFAGVLSDAEIDAVVAYLGTFRPAPH
jgi:high-affinity iron transporter